jgi:anti-anti-sigma factor
MASIRVSGSVLAVTGSLDEGAEADLRRRCREVLGSGAEVVTVDLTGVDMITSVCIGALLVLWMDLRSEGRSAKLLPSPRVKKVLDMVGLASVLAAGAEAE